VRVAKKDRTKILALVNVPNSSLFRIANYAVHLRAGTERVGSFNQSLCGETFIFPSLLIFSNLLFFHPKASASRIPGIKIYGTPFFRRDFAFNFECISKYRIKDNFLITIHLCR